MSPFNVEQRKNVESLRIVEPNSSQILDGSIQLATKISIIRKAVFEIHKGLASCLVLRFAISTANHIVISEERWDVLSAVVK